MKSKTLQSLQHHNLAPHKRFGQNFLVNTSTAESIVSCGKISADDTILEVGVGLGALTNIIAARAGRVIGVEIDKGLIRYHHEEKTLKDNVTLIHDDILKTDFSLIQKESKGKLKILANLPYSISNPFIFKLIENRSIVEWVVVMLQKEVAERLMAKPSTKEYGIPSILLQAYADIDKMLVVRPHEFHPQPKVDSMVIRIAFKEKPYFPQTGDGEVHRFFNLVVRAAFSRRRKTLLNNLSSAPLPNLPKDKKEAKTKALEILESSDISPSERAENLSIEDFAVLSATAYSLLN